MSSKGHASSRLVRAVARELELRLARRGHSLALKTEDFDEIAEQVAELVGAPRRLGLVDARAVAEELGVARDWVYANADRLGAVRLGDGPRARLRFDLEHARRVLAGADAGEPAPDPAAQARAPARTVRCQARPGVALIRGRSARA
jgi:hypothetical protein